jgi:malate/lactate dehydrogenase
MIHKGDAWVMLKNSGQTMTSPRQHDSARFRNRLANTLDIDCKSIEALCLGESRIVPLPITVAEIFLLR